MCGVCGFVRTSEHTVTTWPVVREAFAGIVERGPHAAGYGVLSPEHIISVKAPRRSDRMAYYKKTAERFEGADLFIGHSRYATDGDPKVNRNNHPHATRGLGIVMVHNGVVRDDVDVETETDCDSEILLRILERDGIAKGVRRIARLGNSDYSLLFIHKREGALYAFRNDARPLAFAKMDAEIGGYLISSTEALLREAVDRAGLFQPRRVYTTIPYKLYRFIPGRPVQSFPVKDRPRGWRGDWRDRYPWLLK